MSEFEPARRWGRFDRSRCRSPGSRSAHRRRATRIHLAQRGGGQFVEIPDDVVYAVEYSTHGEMRAVYEIYNVAKPIPPLYHGLVDPTVGLAALEAAFG